jgi:Ca2+-binding EF-hand superfamily protein
MQQFDDDQSGGIEFEEFKAMQGAGKASEAAIRLFKDFDVDGTLTLPRDPADVLPAWPVRAADGAVTAVEIARVLHISDQEARTLVDEVDTDGNGTISFDEWIRAMQGDAAKKAVKKK